MGPVVQSIVSLMKLSVEDSLSPTVFKKSFTAKVLHIFSAKMVALLRVIRLNFFRIVN